MPLPVLFLLLCLGLAVSQYEQPYPVTTPVPILKQINKHNNDGSYSYGYEAADGSYKIESKYPTGEVYGKYGFVDDTGNVREIEYGASRRGFEPAGPGINVPPPTLTGNSVAGPEDDGQYREDPSVYYMDPKYTNGERYEPIARPLTYHQPRAPAVTAYRQPPVPRPPPTQYQQQPIQYQAQYRPEQHGQYQQPRPAYPAQPAPVNENSGLTSYTVNYRR